MKPNNGRVHDVGFRATYSLRKIHTVFGKDISQSRRTTFADVRHTNKTCSARRLDVFLAVIQKQYCLTTYVECAQNGLEECNIWFRKAQVARIKFLAEQSFVIEHLRHVTCSRRLLIARYVTRNASTL